MKPPKVLDSLSAQGHAKNFYTEDVSLTLYKVQFN